jgi:hypothetical protein
MILDWIISYRALVMLLHIVAAYSVSNSLPAAVLTSFVALGVHEITFSEVPQDADFDGIRPANGWTI